MPGRPVSAALSRPLRADGFPHGHELLGRGGVDADRRVELGLGGAALQCDRHALGREKFIECENAVVAVGYEPDRNLAQQLEGAGTDVTIIGDLKAPRRAIDAIEEGFLAGWELFG